MTELFRSRSPMKSTNWSRRQVLKGAGVALSLPWLETFAARKANAQTAPKKRYISVYQPNGTAQYWMPAGAGGAGAAWALSPLLQPFEALKSKMMVFSKIAN